jgi:hypothetical protein
MLSVDCMTIVLFEEGMACNLPGAEPKHTVKRWCHVSEDQRVSRVLVSFRPSI